MQANELFYSQLRIYCRVIVLRAFVLVIAILSDVLFAVELGNITSMILNQESGVATNFLFILGLFLMVLIVNPYLMYKSNQAIFKKSISGDKCIFLQFLNEDPQSIRKWNAGELSSKIVDDAIEYRWAIIDFFAYLIEVVVLLVVLVLFMIKYSWYYILLVVSLICIGSIISKYCSGLQADHQQRKMEADQQINDSVFKAIQDFIVIRINGFTSLVSSKMMQLFERVYLNTYLNKCVADNKVSLYSLLFETFAYICILLFGVFLVTKNVISIGDVLTVTLIFPIFSNEVQHIQAIQKAKKMMKSMNEEMSEFLSHPLIGRKDRFEGLVLEKASYSYDQKRIYEFKDLLINQKDRVAIVGDNGVGKTTLLNVLCGLYEVSGGELLVNGKSSSREILRKLVTYVDAESVMFEDTLESYLKTNQPEWDEALINEFGLSGKLNQLSGQLSGGERKRGDILRALLEKRELLILDEPEVFLDEDWKDKIICLLSNSNQTIIYTTHDEQFINLATKQVVVK